MTRGSQEVPCVSHRAIFTILVNIGSVFTNLVFAATIEHNYRK